MAFLRELMALALGRRVLLRVHGDSMEPTIATGAVVGVRRRRGERPALGSVVVVRDPQRPTHRLVKRVRTVTHASFTVGSDDPWEAVDSRHFGSLRFEDWVGTVLWTWSTQRGFSRT